MVYRISRNGLRGMCRVHVRVLLWWDGNQSIRTGTIFAEFFVKNSNVRVSKQSHDDWLFETNGGRKMRTKYGIVGILTVLTALLMVSTVSAVPYTQEQQYVEQQAIAQEQQDKIQEFMSSPTYTQMREIIDEYLSSEDQEYISTMVSQFLDETDIPLSDDPILDLLITIAEVVMLLLGHNLIGQTVAFLITSLAVLPYAIGVGGIFGAADVLALLFSILESINWEEVIIHFFFYARSNTIFS